MTTTNSYDKLGQVLSISHHTPALPRQGQGTSSVARWDGSLALPGDLSKCPAGTRTITDDTSTEQVTSYLDKRTMPGTGIAGCEKTAAYTSARGLPTPGESFAAGDTLSFSYAYDRVGNVTAETEDRGSHGAVSTGFSYDNLSRLVGSSSTDGTNNTYTYDRVGDRTGWLSSAAPDTGEPLAVAASYNQAGQLVSEARSRPDGVTSVGYSYNNAGQRTQQASTGPDGLSVLSYAYTAAGRMASTTQDGATTTFGYDGLGRNLTTATDGVGASNVWAGMAVVQQHNDNTGTATLVRDALGQVALQSATPGDISAAPAWSLHDRLGSTVAQTTTTGRITDLASYSDFGVPKFASAGFASTTGFTGELSDATTGTNAYFSRTYDPMAATWLSPDSYRGTLTNPRSQHRYGYVQGNPTTLVDQLGFAARAVFDGSRRPPPPSASIHTADGWERASGTGGASGCGASACGKSVVPSRHVRLEALNPTNILTKLGGSIVDSLVGPMIGFVSGAVELVTALWQTSPINWAGQLAFLGPNKTAANFKSIVSGYNALWQAAKKDPGALALSVLGDMFAVNQWATSPGQASGKTGFTILTFLAGGAALKAAGIGTKATEVAAETEAAVSTSATFVASADGVVISTSRARLVAGFEDAGLTKTPTTSPGLQYTLPDGSLVRIMEPAGQAPLRASFTNANRGPINPFTGKPVQPPAGLSSSDRLEYVRARTHVELGP